MPMADPLYSSRHDRTADPLQSSAPPVEDPERELPEHATPSSLGHIPGEPQEPNPRLNNAAEKVGRALGSAVSGVRNVPERVQDTRQRLTVIKGRKGEDAQAAVDEAVERVRETGEQIKEQARETGEQLMERARTTGNELKEQAQVRLAQARSRAQVMAHQEPFRVIAMSAASGFVMGIVLRLWRDHAS